MQGRVHESELRETHFMEEKRYIPNRMGNRHIARHGGWSRNKPHSVTMSPRSPQPRQPSGMVHVASAARFNHVNGMKRKQHISAGAMKSAFTTHQDTPHAQRYSKENRSQENKRHKRIPYCDEVRDMVPSSYSSSLDVREQDDAPYNPMDDHRKEVQMKQKLAHRLIGRFEKDVSGTGKVVSRHHRSVESSDLASAMALASLAYRAPTRNRDACGRSDEREDTAHYARWSVPEVHQVNFPIMTMNSPSKEYYPSDHHPRPIDDKWICDYCHVAAFDTFQEASDHEARCGMRHRCNTPNSSVTVTAPQLQPTKISERRNSQETELTETENDYQEINNNCNDSERHGAHHYFSGTVPLSIPKTDSEWLSELNCYVRDKCVEAFSAKVDDVVKTSKRGRISLSQVGIRCVYCASQNLKDRAVAAVSYPVSISGVYESVKRWQRVHLEACTSIPPDVKKKIKSLSESSVWVPTTRQYWSDSAKALGIVDTSDGLRFAHDPARCTNADEAAACIMNSRFGSSRLKKELQSKQAAKSPSKEGEVKYIVFPEDQALVPPYVYFLMRQVQLCHFSEADRFVARSKSTIGFAGFECRHCLGHAGLGKYFPSSPKGLSTNSTSQNIYSHIMKCRRCPEEIKEKLNNLKKEKYNWPRRTCGWRQAFFDQVWKRLHGEWESH